MGRASRRVRSPGLRPAGDQPWRAAQRPLATRPRPPLARFRLGARNHPGSGIVGREQRRPLRPGAVAQFHCPQRTRHQRVAVGCRLALKQVNPGDRADAAEDAGVAIPHLAPSGVCRERPRVRRQRPQPVPSAPFDEFRPRLLAVLCVHPSTRHAPALAGPPLAKVEKCSLFASARKGHFAAAGAQSPASNPSPFQAVRADFLSRRPM